MDTRTQRYRYNQNPPEQRDVQDWPNVEIRTFDSPEAVPEGEGWVTHPFFVQMPQIESVAAETPPDGTDIAEEIPAASAPPKPKRGRPAKGA